MTVLARLSELLSRASSGALSTLVEAVRTAFQGDPQLRRRVAFSIALIALSAKMAKADGIVSADEVRAFHEIFSVPREEMRNVRRLYDLAKQDVAGFEAYARQMAGLCGSGKANCPMLEDIIDGLFHIAKADGVVHSRELDYLRRVAHIFGFDDHDFERIRAGHLGPDKADPYEILGVSRDMTDAEIKSAWRAQIRENHPDRLIAKGMPAEFVNIATEKIATINAAYDRIAKQRGMS